MTRPIARRAALAALAGGVVSTAAAGSALAQQAVLLYPRSAGTGAPVPRFTGPTVIRPGLTGSAYTSPGMTGQMGYRRLTVVSAHTGEKFSDVFALGNRPNVIAMARLSRLMRDQHNGATKAIDPALIEILARIQTKVLRPIQILSGYRSPETNYKMYLADPGGVAEHSFHTIGKAVDIMVAGASVEVLGKLARQCGAGGVGTYSSGFIHIDTGPVREWVG